LAANAGPITNRASVRSSIDDSNPANNAVLGVGTVLPVVSVVATDPSAAETGLDPAEFLLLRTGGTSSPLAVSYVVSGSASNGLDYVTLNGTVSIPPGAPSTGVTINPLADALAEGDETVILTVLASPAYLIEGSRTHAMITLADNDVTLPLIVSARLDGTSAVIAFTTSPGHNYRLERATDVTKGPWETAAEVPGTGEVVEVSDANGADLANRFYRVQMLP
jgi:hypothetical protein